MPWDDAISHEYDNLIAGVMGQALDIPNNRIPQLKQYIKDLEISSIDFTPTNQNSLSHDEAVKLHLIRAAWSFWMERNNIWPWKLQENTVDELRPLLSWHYQGFQFDRWEFSGWTIKPRWRFHAVWDVKPELRIVFAMFAQIFWAIDGKAVRSQYECITRVLTGLREMGFHHMMGYYEEYEGYYNHGLNEYDRAYDVDDILEVGVGGCHTTSGLLVAELRGFNIPAHIGRKWPLQNGKPKSIPGWGSGSRNNPDRWDYLHWGGGHCCIHFPTISSWLQHGDDIYNRLFKTYPIDYALKSEWFIATYQWSGSEYRRQRAIDYDAYSWWVFLLGESDEAYYDVRWNYYNGYLRNRLETIHINNRYHEMEGAPDPVPPLFTPEEVDNWMSWVESKLG